MNTEVTAYDTVGAYGCCTAWVRSLLSRLRLCDIPTARTSRAMLMVRRQQGVKREILAEVYLTKIAGLLDHLLKLDRL